MTEPCYITASCQITPGKVVKDGALLMENENIAPISYLQWLYEQKGYNYPKFYKMDGLSRLGWLAAECLLEGSFDKNRYAPEQVGLICCNRNSSLDTDTRYYDTVKTIPSPALFVYTLPNIVLGEICIRHQFRGENDFFIFERFEPVFLQAYVQQLMQENVFEACICGWLEFLGEAYQACLYLVEKPASKNSVPFTTATIQTIYENTHG
ncbi:MAG: hypothetical protein KGO82_04955 [Bacteroidota bacterium]|nr:hypothetical protein [Bacteroidota bacterium]